MGHARSPGVPARLPIGERSRGNWNIVREPGFLQLAFLAPEIVADGCR
jgi:hypothetical protein